MPDIKERLVELVGEVLRCQPWGEVSYFTANEIANELISNGVTISEWISVEERLPTEDDGDAVGAVLAIHKATKKKYWHWGNVAENPCDFTHWMPLPAPPEEVP